MKIVRIATRTNSDYLVKWEKHIERIQRTVGQVIGLTHASEKREKIEKSTEVLAMIKKKLSQNGMITMNVEILFLKNSQKNAKSGNRRS